MTIDRIARAGEARAWGAAEHGGQRIGYDHQLTEIVALQLIVRMRSFWPRLASNYENHQVVSLNLPCSCSGL
jgi:hypothetical protein